MRYFGKVTVMTQDKVTAVNDITSYGFKTLFSNFVGQTSRKFKSVVLGYAAPPMDCEAWRSPTPIEFPDIGESLFTSIRVHSSGPTLGTSPDGYLMSTYTLSFTILPNEGNLTYNLLGLSLDDDKLFAIARIPEITKSDKYSLIVKWDLNIIKTDNDNYITNDGLSMFIQNMLPDVESEAAKTVSYEYAGTEIASGSLLADIGTPEFTSNQVSMASSLITTISVPGTYTCDKILVKAGSSVFADVNWSGNEWTFTNESEEKLRINNGVKWDITMTEELSC